MLAPPTAWLLAEAPLWQLGYRGTFVLLAIMLIRLCFTLWARIHLGRLWSGVITHKRGTRSSIGALTPSFATQSTRTCCRAIRDSGCRATVPALIGAALMIFGFWLKGRSEEQFLRIELGPESYAAYCRRVPMIVPFITPGERSSRRPHANQ